jgi:hypothetical protein
MEPNRKLPVVAFIIDKGSLIPALRSNAAVDRPAIEQNWMAFKRHEEYTFSAQKDRKIVTGPIMVPDFPIYRKDEMGEYYGFFTKETIWDIFLQWYRYGNTIPVNFMHDSGDIIDAYMIEFFIVDRDRGVLPPENYKSAKDGTAFASYYIEDDEFWQDYIKTGIVRGFSIEGLFQRKYLVEKPENQIKSLADRIKAFRAKLANL